MEQFGISLLQLQPRGLGAAKLLTIDKNHSSAAKMIGPVTHPLHEQQVFYILKSAGGKRVERSNATRRFLFLRLPASMKKKTGARNL